MKVIFLLVLFLDYKLVRLSKNVIVLSLSDEDAFDRGEGAFDLEGLLTAYAISSGGGRLTGVTKNKGLLTGGQLTGGRLNVHVHPVVQWLYFTPSLCLTLTCHIGQHNPL